MTEVEDRINKKKLHELYCANGDVQVVLDHFANRERNQNTSTVARLMANIPSLSRGQVVSVLKELERLGCGEFKAGRKGFESRFEWHVSSKSVGQVAAGEEAEIEEEVPSLNDEADEATDELIEHRYQLRPNLAIALSLPADLSQGEAQRLATYIRTLPFSNARATEIIGSLPVEDFSDWEK